MPGIAGADKFAAMIAAKKGKKPMPKKGGKKSMPPMKPMMKKGGKIEKADAGALSGLY